MPDAIKELAFMTSLSTLYVQEVIFTRRPGIHHIRDGKTGAKQAEIQSRTGGGRQYLIASDGIDNPPLRRIGGNVTGELHKPVDLRTVVKFGNSGRYWIDGSRSPLRSLLPSTVGGISLVAK